MGGKYKPVKGGAANNPLGKRWIGLSTEKYKGYGIHGNSQPTSIGKYISAGCIRMINEDVEELFQYIPIKTEVWVGTEEVLEKWGIRQYIEYEKNENVYKIVLRNKGWQLMLRLPSYPFRFLKQSSSPLFLHLLSSHYQTSKYESYAIY